MQLSGEKEKMGFSAICKNTTKNKEKGKE